MRILCLHGLGTNSQILEMQTGRYCKVYSSGQRADYRLAALRAELGGSSVHSFEFVDGSLDWEPAPGMLTFKRRLRERCQNTKLVLGIPSEMLSENGPLAFYDPYDPESILTALDDLDEYVEDAGPFDGILGFSQGAALAAMLLVRHGAAKPPVLFAVFICGGQPYNEDILKKGVCEFIDPTSDEQIIHVPTANILGGKDKDLDHTERLLRLCQSWGRFSYDHGAGHEIPRTPKGVTEEMARVIEQAMLKSTLGQ